MRNRNQGRAITIAAAISKEDLEQVGPLYGATNAGQFAGHPPGTLRLDTFAGKYAQSTGKFIGEYRFTATDSPGAATYSALPGVPNEVPGKRSRKAEAVEEVTHV